MEIRQERMRDSERWGQGPGDDTDDDDAGTEVGKERVEDLSLLSQGDEDLIQCLEDILEEDELKPTAVETGKDGGKMVQRRLTEWLRKW